MKEVEFIVVLCIESLFICQVKKIYWSSRLVHLTCRHILESWSVYDVSLGSAAFNPASTLSYTACGNNDFPI